MEDDHGSEKQKIAFLGDSITEGAGASSPDHVYWRAVERLTGAHCFGYGIGGTRIAPQHFDRRDPKWDRDFCSRVADMDPDMDVVAVLGGTNDFGHGDAPFGKLNAIQPIAAYYAIPVLDLFRTSGIQPAVDVLQERYMPDGLHPNDAGNEKIARRFIGFMSAL